MNISNTLWIYLTHYEHSYNTLKVGIVMVRITVRVKVAYNYVYSPIGALSHIIFMHIIH